MTVSIEMPQRDISIDIIRTLAVFAIINSHMGLLYGRYSVLATGGAVGDALFFFISGFTLFSCKSQSFWNYYKRRINRIYPAVFSWALVRCLLFDDTYGIVDIILNGGGWFISCIMIYYIPFYFFRKHLRKNLHIVMLVYVATSISLYWLFCDVERYNMYGTTYYKWIHYFIFMLQGAVSCSYCRNKSLTVTDGRMELFKAIVCIAFFYSLCLFRYNATWHFVQVLSLVPLMCAIHYIYRLAHADGLCHFFTTTRVGIMMNVVGSLCLEIYLVHFVFLTDMCNNLFPLNIPLYLLIVLCAAYILRCVARLWSQTFKEAPYDWKAVFQWT